MDLIGRVKGVLLKPKDEFAKAVSEPSDLKSILIPYVIILAAIKPAMDFLSHGLIGVYIPAQHIFGMTVGGGFIRTPVYSLVSSIVMYGLLLGTWWFFGFILSALSTAFGGRKDMAGGLKAAAYATTPLWVSGVFSLLGSVPYLGWLGALAMLGGLVYTAILTIWAVPFFLGTPDDKKIGHGLAAFGIVLVSFVVAMFVIMAILGAILIGAVGAGLRG
jgi:Yip1 domain